MEKIAQGKTKIIWSIPGVEDKAIIENKSISNCKGTNTIFIFQPINTSLLEIKNKNSKI